MVCAGKRGETLLPLYYTTTKKHTLDPYQLAPQSAPSPATNTHQQPPPKTHTHIHTHTHTHALKQMLS